MSNSQMNQDFKNALWATANKLRGSVDPSDYKYPVLGLIFLKYVSESFVTRQSELAEAFTDPSNEFYLEDESLRLVELEERDYYRATNTFWIPESARWSFIQANAKQSNIAVLLDDAMRLVEEDNAINGKTGCMTANGGLAPIFVIDTRQLSLDSELFLIHRTI